MKLFEPYISFLNLDVEQYMASMTHAGASGGGGDDDDDEEEGLGVAMVNLEALRAVLSKHQVDLSYVQCAARTAETGFKLYMSSS